MGPVGCSEASRVKAMTGASCHASWMDMDLEVVDDRV
jgi:hypothetical protein